jgi:hypothetical protein
MGPFESLVKRTDPFSEKCTEMRKIKYIDKGSISMYYNLYHRLYYKGKNYVQIQFSKY